MTQIHLFNRLKWALDCKNKNSIERRTTHYCISRFIVYKSFKNQIYANHLKSLRRVMCLVQKHESESNFQQSDSRDTSYRPYNK